MDSERSGLAHAAQAAVLAPARAWAPTGQAVELGCEAPGLGNGRGTGGCCGAASEHGESERQHQAIIRGDGNQPAETGVTLE